MDSEFISQQPLAAHKKQQQSPERPLQKQTGPIRLPSFAREQLELTGKIAIAPEREVLIAQKIGEVQFLSSTAFI
jgi:hypothetical protein